MITEIPCVESINKIRKRYYTGEEPVLVECDNLQTYICKYMRSSASGYKLACELIGSLLACRCNIYTPNIAYVKIKGSDWPHFSSINLSASAFGSKVIAETIDITRVSYGQIPMSDELGKQLLRIALFDIWVGNEDRNYNNSNLLYDLKLNKLVAIDHGCIFNTASYDFPLSLLTANESIIQSNLGEHLLSGIDYSTLCSYIDVIKEEYATWVKLNDTEIKTMVNLIPEEWNIPSEIVKDKLVSLATQDWINSCWNNFMEIIEDTEYV